MKGRSSPGGQDTQLWKYSIQSNTFSELMFPEDCRRQWKSTRYLLTSYKSHLHFIRADLDPPNAEPREWDEEIHDMERWTHYLKLHSYKLSRSNVWEGERYLCSLRATDPLDTKSYDEDDEYHGNDNLEEYRSRDPLHWDVSAASNNDCLLVAFFRMDKYNDDEDPYFDEDIGRQFIHTKIVIFDEPTLCYTDKFVEGPHFSHDSEDSYSITKPLFFIHDDNVLLNVWTLEDVQKTSLRGILKKGSSWSTWNKSCSIPKSAQHSNLTLLGNQPVMTISSSTCSNTTPNEDMNLYVCALTSCNTVVELFNFNLFRFNPAPVIAGLSDGSKLVAIGMLAIDNVRPDLHVLQLVPQGMYA